MIVDWDDFDETPMANLLAKFKMPRIERYIDIGYPRIHLRLYSMVMSTHGLDEARITSYVFEWHNSKLVCIFGFLSPQDLG